MNTAEQITETKRQITELHAKLKTLRYQQQQAPPTPSITSFNPGDVFETSVGTTIIPVAHQSNSLFSFLGEAFAIYGNLPRTYSAALDQLNAFSGIHRVGRLGIVRDDKSTQTFEEWWGRFDRGHIGDRYECGTTEFTYPGSKTYKAEAKAVWQACEHAHGLTPKE